jgi:hypothetical protein
MTTKNNSEDELLLIEAVTNAWRPRHRGQLGAHPNWYDLDEAARLAAHDETSLLRAMEAALDPEGLSTTVRAVLAQVRGQ